MKKTTFNMLGKRLIAGFHHCTKHHSCSKSLRQNTSLA